MTQTSNRFFDEIARLMNDAAGVASGVRREFDTLVRTQADRVLRELDLVQREEFEAVKEMARMAREENEVLHSRLAMLEARLVPAEAPPVTPAPPSAVEPKAEAAPAPPSTSLAHDPPAVEPPPAELPPSSPYGPGNPPTT
jgi:BMFP domain-containing protein YqiC